MLRGAEKWQNIAVIDLRSLDGIGKRLQSAGLKTLGEIDEMDGVALLKLPGMGVGIVRRARGVIRACKADERRRKSAAAVVRLRVPRSPF
jgi:hypothetical protein